MLVFTHDEPQPNKPHYALKLCVKPAFGSLMLPVGPVVLTVTQRDANSNLKMERMDLSFNWLRDPAELAALIISK